MSGSRNHPVSILRERHQPVAYPDGVLGVERAIPGTAFFPGGHGLWAARAGVELPAFPYEGVMVVGHDFHSKAGYEASLRRGREAESQPTWRNLIHLLRAADIPLEQCFFTNFYMGLREGSKTTGLFPGAKSEDFKAHCRRFFIEQVKTMRPSLMITLGRFVPNLIASLSPELGPWQGTTTLNRVDEVGPVLRDCRFDRIDGFSTTVVALTHPSMRHVAVKSRFFRGSRGSQAELAMLRSARGLSAEPNRGSY